MLRSNAAIGIMAMAALLSISGCDRNSLLNGENAAGNQDPEITIPGTENLAPSIGADGGTSTVSFKSAASWTASVTTSKAGEWISVSPTSGRAGDATITISVQKNEEAEPRTATVNIVSGNVVKAIQVSQEAGALKEPEWYTKPFWKRSDREKAGLIGPVKTVRETMWEPCYEYEFDEEGHLVAERRFRHQADASPETTIYHSYDKDGHRIRTATFKEGATPEPGVDEEITFTYGNGDRLVLVGVIGNLDWAIPRGQNRWMVGFQGDDFFVGLSSIRKWDYNDPLNKRYWDEDFVFDDAGRMTCKQYSFWTAASAGRDGEKSNEYHNEYTVTYNGNFPKSLRTTEPYGTDFTWKPNGMPDKVQILQQEDTYTWLEDRHTEMVWADNPRYATLSSYYQDTGHVGSLDVKSYKQTYNDSWDIARKDATYNQNGDITYYEDYSDYQYDKYGNWIARNVEVIGLLDRNVSKSHYGRKIVYY